MKAVGVYIKQNELNEEFPLIDFEVDLPLLGEHDLLVKVEAVSVNPADYRVRQRSVDNTQPIILGWDVAGIVVNSGKRADRFKKGDKVYYAGDLNRAGANSQFHAVDSRLVSYRPKNISATDAAAIPLAGLAMWEALFEHLNFPEPNNLCSIESLQEQSLLIVGGAGGTGSIAIQLAKLIPKVKVITTASRSESKEWCKKMGADIVIDHSSDMYKQIECLDLPPVRNILCLAESDEHFFSFSRILAPQGKICSIVPFKQPVDLNPLMEKSITFSWEFMFTRSMFSTEDMGKQAHILSKIACLIESGKIHSIVSKNLGRICAENLSAAHDALKTKRTLGKLVLQSF